jgi:hypothetical protein
MEQLKLSRDKSVRRGTTSTSTTQLLVVLVLIVILTIPATEAFPVYIRTGRNGNGNGGSAGAASQRGSRPPRPGTSGGSAGGGSSPHYEIERPHECRNDTIFADCFLCGKIADDIRIYRACCQRDAEIISFCYRLLS